MISTDSKRGRIALMVGHCVGMIDLIALPLWVGTLMAHYRFDPQQAGMLVSLFLVFAVLASLVIAPRFDRIKGRTLTAAGYGLAAIGFGFASTSTDFTVLAVLHGLCGAATGAALSVTHGTVARSAHPHRLFAHLGIAIGVFGVLFMGSVPRILAVAGGTALFQLFAGVMAVGALIAAAAFPNADAAGRQAGSGVRPPMDRAIWYGIAGISGMTTVQAMTFSFLERAGMERGFGAGAIAGVLIAMGLVNLLPAAFAALLEKKLAARSVMLAGAVLQAVLAMIIMSSPSFGPYAAASAVLVAVLIFTHTFAFGLLARMDPSGRAMAATPAMVMVGAAIGPVLGGTLVKAFGYGSLGIAALAIGLLAVGAFSRLPRSSSGVEPVGVSA